MLWQSWLQILEKADQIIILDIEYNLRALFLNH